MGIEDEEQIWNILKKNPYAMNKLRSIASGGTMVLSDILTEWELGIGALQSKIIRRIIKYVKEEKNKTSSSSNNVSSNNTNSNNNNDDKKEQEKESNNDKNENNENNDNTNNGNTNADHDKKEPDNK